MKVYGTMTERAMCVYGTMREMAKRVYGITRGRATRVYGTMRAMRLYGEWGHEGIWYQEGKGTMM